MSFVDFMIIGAQKSGTTTFSQILSNHPNVCFSREKEPHFFSKSPDWRNCIEDYKTLYQPKEMQICGEASTTYTCYPEFNKDIWHSLYEFNPNLKFIYLMREPVARIISHWMHNYLKGYTSKSFEEEVFRNPSYINRTRYFVQIKPYLELFGRDKVLLLSFEEFIQNQNYSLQKTSEFLDIDFTRFKKFQKIHSNRSVGESKENIRVEKFKQNSLVTDIKSFLPQSVKKITYNTFRYLTDKKIESRPIVSDEFKKAIWDLLILDVLEIEKLIGRELSEWNPPTDFLFSSNKSRSTRSEE